MSEKKITKEETDVRIIGSELESLLRIFSRVQGGGTPVTDETNKKIGDTIKD